MKVLAASAWLHQNADVGSGTMVADVTSRFRNASHRPPTTASPASAQPTSVTDRSTAARLDPSRSRSATIGGSGTGRPRISDTLSRPPMSL